MMRLGHIQDTARYLRNDQVHSLRAIVGVHTAAKVPRLVQYCSEASASTTSGHGRLRGSTESTADYKRDERRLHPVPESSPAALVLDFSVMSRHDILGNKLHMWPHDVEER